MRDILDQLPYSKPFRFVDNISMVDSDAIQGSYTFSPDLEFYKGHFKDDPITPGVILTECMAQIGLVCLGIYLLNRESLDSRNVKIALSNTSIEFLKPVYPGEQVRVLSEKQYFRFNKLKCRVMMQNEAGDIVAKGTISGMIIKTRSEK